MADNFLYPLDQKKDSCPGAGPEQRASILPSSMLSAHPKDMESLLAEPSLTSSERGAIPLSKVE
jgi:hypothetical protein